MHDLAAAPSRRTPEPNARPERGAYRRDIDCAPGRRARDEPAGPSRGRGRGRGNPDPERWERRDDRSEG